MAKRRPFKKTRPGGPIPLTARQLESFILEHNGRFNSREYDKFERMELTCSPVRDAIHELKTYSLETLAQHFGVRLLGRGKRVFARLDSEDDTWYHFSPAYIPRALNNRDVNDVIVQMFFIGKWKVHKLSLWAEPEDIVHYSNDSNKTFYHLVNRWYSLEHNRVLKVIVHKIGVEFFLDTKR